MSDITPTFQSPGEPVLDDTGSLKIEHYTRRVFDVDVVRVSKENMALAAKWCGGEILEDPEKGPYILVPVHRPLNTKQKMAFVTDCILKGDTGFKVYVEKAFEASFVKKEN